MRVCILGGGGNVAEGIAALLLNRGHSVSLFRFEHSVRVAGVPKRPRRNSSRIDRVLIHLPRALNLELPSYRPVWATANDMRRADVFVYAFPSYLCNSVGRRLAPFLANKPLINLSDRFMGTYSLMYEMVRTLGSTALPAVAAAFNGVPVMAQKVSRDGRLVVYHEKTLHAVAWAPWNTAGEVMALIHAVFGYSPSQLSPYPSFFHLAFENIHSIEHSVIDLDNLKNGYYDRSGFAYSSFLYSDKALARIEAIRKERDFIASHFFSRSYLTLGGYDCRAFAVGAVRGVERAGTADYRTSHSHLSLAPSPTRCTAFGYEDTGWAIVPLEGIARLIRVATPSLRQLIDEWEVFTRMPYRNVGRSIKALGLRHETHSNVAGVSFPLLGFFPYRRPVMPCAASPRDALFG